MLILLENYPQALAALDRVEALGHAPPGIHYFRAIILDKAHMYKPALASYEKYLALADGSQTSQGHQEGVEQAMIRRRQFLAGWLAVVSGGILRADLKAVKAEPRLEKRAEKALKNAHAMLDAAREAYRKGDSERMKAALDEVTESVKLAYRSLKDTGKNPRKRAKPFKRAEISTRQLLRRLDSFRDEMSYQDREQLDGVIGAVRKVNEDLLHDVMGGGR